MAKKLPDFDRDFAQWYQEIVYEAELADVSPVRGCMVVRPYGNAIWENIKNILDRRIKETGHKNALFPLLIPQKFLTKEAEHVEGFSPELAVVTHAGGKELDEPLVIRPTSETIIHYMFARWLNSWRDLPLKINQWGNVVRWEMRTRPFLRTTEIFWQEGHTAHETNEEASQEADMMLHEYKRLAEEALAIPVVAGIKSESEKFPGADKTMSIEGLMPDGKALQMGTSHMISQNFAKAFEMTYQNREGVMTYPFLTSWGMSTRVVGAVIMSHGDNKGLVIPPNIAPIHIVIIPILKKNADNNAVLEAAEEIREELSGCFSVEVDDDDSKSPGAKFYKWELKGVPLRIEIGPRDVEAHKAVVADRLGLKKEAVPLDSLSSYVKEQLILIQKTLFERAQQRMKSQWHIIDKVADHKESLVGQGGFYQAGWCGCAECEKKLKEYQATIRCVLPDEEKKQDRICFACEKKALHEVLIAKAY